MEVQVDDQAELDVLQHLLLLYEEENHPIQQRLENISGEHLKDVAACLSLPIGGKSEEALRELVSFHCCKNHPEGPLTYLDSLCHRVNVVDQERQYIQAFQGSDS